MDDHTFILYGHRGLKKTVKDILALLFIWSPAVTALIVACFNSKNFTRDFFISLIICLSCSILCSVWSLIAGVLKRWYFLARKGIRIDVGIFESYLYAAPVVPLGMWIGFEIVTADPTWGMPGRPTLRDYKVGMLFGSLIMGGTAMFQLYNRANSIQKDLSLQLKSKENEILRAKLKSLTNQTNPHLLFNSLNTVAATIADDPEKAEDMLVDLSKLYRMLCDVESHEHNTLAEELAICAQYLKVQKHRHEDRISFAIRTSGTGDPASIKIPVLSLQMLVENALKHGILPQVEGGRVEIAADASQNSCQLTVKDDGVGFGNSTDKSGAGSALSNLKKRYELLYGEKANIKIKQNVPRGTIVRITFPPLLSVPHA